ncbi:2TM domain-containing protein [Hymenobacter tibetensis]|uniref:2TM domain-containing protein n=1 Tax=Hymenobacter tibetensis TaxID=497967 RepID=A0ABY4D3G2_9BACT|nr:2TM domain-containing protein [Hymenobacter tibetensis]UOG75749.1 2TM domain-containing protein [Hymenobacter tibetensis]
METPPRDPQLWRMALDRAEFKSSLVTYALVNALLWSIWALTGQEARPIPWPMWVAVFWGIGLVLKGIKMYAGFGPEQQSEREYEKLIRRRESRL